MKIETVAPHAGAWIETVTIRGLHKEIPVAPHAGAWIETHRGRDWALSDRVAPHAGAWIETPAQARPGAGHAGRAPRGRVD